MKPTGWVPFRDDTTTTRIVVGGSLAIGSCLRGGGLHNGFVHKHTPAFMLLFLTGGRAGRQDIDRCIGKAGRGTMRLMVTDTPVVGFSHGLDT